jgi:hypothetical protein
MVGSSCHGLSRRFGPTPVRSTPRVSGMLRGRWIPGGCLRLSEALLPEMSGPGRMCHLRRSCGLQPMVSLRHASRHLTRAIAHRHASELTLRRCCAVVNVPPMDCAAPSRRTSVSSARSRIPSRWRLRGRIRMRRTTMCGLRDPPAEAACAAWYPNFTRRVYTRNKKFEHPLRAPPDRLAVSRPTARGIPPPLRCDNPPSTREFSAHPGFGISYNAPLKLVHRLYTLLRCHGNQPI